MDGNNIDVGNIIFKTQKKLLSTFANRKTIGPVLDDDNKKVLNCAYVLFKEACGKKEAQKITSQWIKILVKIAFLVKNDQLNKEELQQLVDVQPLFGTFVKTVVSFWRITFSFDCSHLQEKLTLIEIRLTKIVERHMTDKNKCKLKHIFQFITKEDLLTNIYSCDKSSKLGMAMNDFSKSLESLVINNSL